MSEQSIAIVIPARMGSSRFPGKPLVSLAGKPMIQWVVEAASSSGLTSQIVVATPDLEIYEACGAFGGEGDHDQTHSRNRNGSDRRGS